MYPFGSGMPPMQNNQQQPPYPSNVQFGAGNCWNQPPQQQQQHQQYQQTNDYSSPYASGNNPPYPTTQPGYSTTGRPPYPPGRSSPYPSSGLAPYPGSTYANAQTPYESAQSHYSTASQPPYPGGSSQAPYPPSGSQPPYPGSQSQSGPFQQYQSAYNQNSAQAQSRVPTQAPAPSQYVSPYGSTNMAPNMSQNMNPIMAQNMTPNMGQNTHMNPIAASNMAQCFSEVRQTMSPLNAANANSARQQGTPTVVPAQNFDPIKDAHALRKAMKGFGTDEDALIEIICHRTNEQRQEIQRQYKTNFGKDLIEDIKSETSGNFEKLLVGLLRPIVDFYCMELCDAMKGLGTDEDVLIEILCTLSNTEIHTIKNHYLKIYGAHLESELKSETSGNFKRLLVSLCTAARDESGRIDPTAAQNDAKELLKAGELRVGTDESMFNMVLCQRNYQQLKLILTEYERITGHSLEKAIKREFSGDIQEGLLAICKCVTNKAEYFASRLHKSMAGMGTNDRQLIRVIVTRSEIDLQDIKVAFERLYGKSLKSWIKGDTSGHYKHALYALIGEQRSS